MSRDRTFVLDDHVRLRHGHPEQVGDDTAIVARTWHDEELDGPPPAHDSDPLNRDLEDGEYGIGLLQSHKRLIVRGEDLELLDRTFAVGQLCRLQEGNNSMSGVVAQVDRFIEVEHVVSKQRIPDRIPAGEVRPASCIENGDHVVYDNWVGIVMDIFVEGAIKTPWSPTPIKMARILDHPLQIGPVNNVVLAAFPNGAPPGFDAADTEQPVLCDLRQTVVYIDWLAINPKLSPEEQERHPKPSHFWTDLDQLTTLRQEYNRLYMVNDIVVFKTCELRHQYGLRSVTMTSQLPSIEAMRVSATHSRVRVCWQDGSESVHDGKELRIYSEMHENDAYRGEHVLFKDADGVEGGAVVHSIDPEERIAQILPYGKLQEAPIMISAFDIKTAGAPGFANTLPRGHVVLTAPNLNAYAPPQVSKVGSLEPLHDLTDEEIDRKLQSMGDRLHRQTVNASSAPTQRRPRAAEEATEIDWYGIVVDLQMDGRAVIRLPSRREIVEDLKNIAILQDGFYDADHFLDDDASDINATDEDAPWMTEDGAELEGEDWEDMGEQDGNAVQDIVLNDEELDLTGADQDKEDEQAVAAQITPAIRGHTLDGDREPCKTFEVLEEAPSDHAYRSASNGGTAPSKKFLTRLQREYKILQSSLPHDILVRAYEDRTDLLRALIIGSSGTPYEDAPICIDIQLKPSYPDEAPLAFFHSWSDGHGRLSPNLYEDGNVCLSVLGTWAGEASESWNPAKSTLLQVLVSIQGLVLVAEPYFTEPGFERERDTENGRSNSRLYSERAYILARRAILHAIKHPVQSFQDELRKIYYQEGRLKAVVEKSAALIAAANATAPNGALSHGSDTFSEGAWRHGDRITKGSALALQRILDGLKAAQDAK